MGRNLILALLLCGLAFPAAAIDPAPAFSDPERQARYERLTEELRCLVCQNQTIADSNAGLAGDLRREVRELIESGMSDEEILDYLVERYGNFVRYRPPLNAQTIVLWAAPLTLVLIGALVGISVIRRRATMSIDDEDEGGAGEGSTP